MNDLITLLTIYFAIFISSPLIVVLHELGHAFAYLAFTKPDSIDIYIGSYIKPQNAIQFQTGKIKFHLKRSFPFIKGIGLCKSSKAENNYLKYIIILLAGSVFTFFTACIVAIIAFNTNASLLVKISCYIFLGFSALSLITNLVPKDIERTEDINLSSDGQQIFLMLKIKRTLPDYIEGCQLFNDKDYSNATAKLRNVLVATPKNRKILNLLVSASLASKQYDEGFQYHEKLENKFELSAFEILNKGCLQSLTGQHDEAIETYSKVLKKDRHNVVALNNIAYELIEKGAYKVAQPALEKAIRLKPEFDHPYSTFGYLKILQGELEDGKSMINKCLELNSENANAYKALGIYYLKLEDIEKATTNFNKALALDSTIDLGRYAEELKLSV